MERQKGATQLYTRLHCLMPPTTTMAELAMIRGHSAVELISLTLGQWRGVNRILMPTNLATISYVVDQPLPCPEHPKANKAMHFLPYISPPDTFGAMDPASMNSKGLARPEKRRTLVASQWPETGGVQNTVLHWEVD